MIDSLKVIKRALEANNIPMYLYTIGNEEEDKTCIVQEENNIHVFVYQKGKRGRQSVHAEPLSALMAIANTFENKYQQRILNYIGS